MSADPVTATEAQAIDWIVRQRAPDFDDWDGFADWLAEAPGHAEIYDALASLDVDLAALPPTGWTLSCFPVKIERASAGWIRAVALIDGAPVSHTD